MFPTVSHLPLFAAATLVVAACQPLGPATNAWTPEASRFQAAGATTARMPVIVSTNCRGCHAPVRHLASPNPTAPSFADIANMEGLTRNTLAAFLRDAHNYPDQMDMELTDQEVGEIVDYILTLRDPLYRPMPS